MTKNFTTPEILNKYRHVDKEVNENIKQKEMTKEKYENLDKIISKNINKIKEKKSVKNFTSNCNYDDDDDVSLLDKSNYDYDTIFSDIYKHYKFDNDDNILNSFSKIYKEHDIECHPRDDTKFVRVRYLLKKLKENNDVPTNLYIILSDDEQTGSSVNNIIIKDLDKGILRVRYLNNRKLTNNLLKHDYKISKNMVNVIKYNKDIHKLSKNEMKIYHELQKFLNKEQDIHILIGSYLSGNNSKKLYNKISSMLYYKLKNKLISKNEYTNLINRINKI